MLQQKDRKSRSSFPIYRELADEISCLILSGHYEPGARLPAELELARDRGLSRTTVRLAMSELEKAGLIYRRRGEGTFVRRHSGRTRAACSAFDAFVQDHRKRMKREVLEMDWSDAGAELAAALKLSASSSVLHFRRLDRLDGQTMSLDEGWIAGVYSQALGREDLEDFDFFERWRLRIGIHLVKSHFELYADAADLKTSQLLGIKRHSPLLVECSDLFTESGGACRIVTRYRHDLYHFKSVLHYE